MEPKHRKILIGCIVMSLALHTGLLTLLHQHTHSFSSQIAVNVGHCSQPPSENIALKEAFLPPVTSLSSFTFEPQIEKITKNLVRKPILIEKPTLPFSFTAQPSIECLLSSQEEILPTFIFHLPSIQSVDLFTDHVKHLIISVSKDTALSKNPDPSPETISHNTLSASRSIHMAPDVTIKFPMKESVAAQEDLTQVAASPAIFLPNLPQLPTLAELDTVNLSDFFETDIVFTPQTDGHGYSFALTLIPHKTLKIPKLHQKITFLIDRSNSIQSERLSASKIAVRKALEELDQNDEFNIIAFDNKAEKLFHSFSAVTPDSLQEADTFLQNILLGSFFSPADLYKPLLLSTPSQVQSEELYSIILLTDGESLAKPATRKALLQNWTALNYGCTSLYVLGVGNDDQLPLLDSICSVNNGTLFTSTTLRGLKRNLLKITKNIHNPIATHLVSKTIVKNSDAQIEIHQDPSLASHLYLDHPYVILGSTEHLDDFILFVQGKIKDGWLNIKKTISFANAKKGSSSLNKDIALQKVYSLYKQHVLQNDPESIAEANEMIKTYDLPVVLE